ncbi:hypothetical protein A6V29_03145 [Blastococcus sp. CCUG 61487]|nr:hypothetical protein A6V29_03145 [Blastococcus sp. CCUG 61487]
MGDRPLGYPTSSELTTPDGVGRLNAFQHGAIYWRPQTGPKAVRGAIYQRYASLGWETSGLGYPMTDELATPDGRGRYSAFQWGNIYWTPWTGANAVWGAISVVYAQQGWERGALGYPLTSEMRTPSRIGRYNHFEGNGSIYWAPQTGAHVISGHIRMAWADMGWENSELGFPASPEYALEDGGRGQDFEFGWIEWYPGEGATAYVEE